MRFANIHLRSQKSCIMICSRLKPRDHIQLPDCLTNGRMPEDWESFWISLPKTLSRWLAWECYTSLSQVREPSSFASSLNSHATSCISSRWACPPPTPPHRYMIAKGPPVQSQLHLPNSQTWTSDTSLATYLLRITTFEPWSVPLGCRCCSTDKFIPRYFLIM
jgi:hypothetical protein